MNPPPRQTWTILTLLHWTSNYFQDKGVSEPRAAAEVLLAHSLRIERLALYLQYDKPLTPDELTHFKTLIRRRLAGEPTQYITGHQEFWSLNFMVNQSVLIPRPETETLVEAILEQLRQPDFPPTNRYLLDIGTGSGVLAVVLSRERPTDHIIALDVSATALTLAQENARRHQVADRIQFIQGELFQPLSRGPSFGVIMANPPYVPTAEWTRLPREIRLYEPRLALNGGPDGLALIRRLVSEAYHYLIPGGLLALEVGHDQTGAVQNLLAAAAAYGPGEIRRDYQGVPRVVLARRR